MNFFEIKVEDSINGLLEAVKMKNVQIIMDKNCYKSMICSTRSRRINISTPDDYYIERKKAYDILKNSNNIDDRYGMAIVAPLFNSYVLVEWRYGENQYTPYLADTIVYLSLK